MKKIDFKSLAGAVSLGLEPDVLLGLVESFQLVEVGRTMRLLQAAQVQFSQLERSLDRLPSSDKKNAQYLLTKLGDWLDELEAEIDDPESTLADRKAYRQFAVAKGS